MTCDREALSAYLDGELTPDERRVVASHLGACDACRKELSALSALTQDLWAIEPPPIDPTAIDGAVRAARDAVGRLAQDGGARAGRPHGGGGGNLLAWLGWLITGRVSIPVPGLAIGVIALALALGRGDRRTGPVTAHWQATGGTPPPRGGLVSLPSSPSAALGGIGAHATTPGGTLSYSEEWDDSRAIWGAEGGGGEENVRADADASAVVRPAGAAEAPGPDGPWVGGERGARAAPDAANGTAQEPEFSVIYEQHTSI